MADQVGAFSELGWDDLTEWAGERVVARGRNYKSSVRDLRIDPSGALLAWVDGTESYATRVRMDSDGSLSYACSCPYGWGPCKHAVAVVLVYLDALSNNRTVDETSMRDKRIALLDEYLSDAEMAAIDPKGIGEGPSPDATVPLAELREKLESMTKQQLVAYIMHLIGQHREIVAEIVEEMKLERGEVDDIVELIRGDIVELANEPAWVNSWTGEGNVPDYGPVRERLEALLENGYPDTVVDLGEELWECAKDQVEQSDDEGETVKEIASCMEVVFRAIPRSSVPPPEQVLWMIGKLMDDDFNILNNVENLVSRDAYSEDQWSDIADTLLQELDKEPTPKEESRYFEGWRRGMLLDWVIAALENGGRRSEVIPLLQREAPIIHRYETLIDHLLAEARQDEARQVAKEGFRKTIDHSPGIAWALEERLREMAVTEENLPLVAAYRATELFHQPSLDAYKALEEAARNAEQWDLVREGVFSFLETGVPPDGDQPRAQKRGKGSKATKKSDGAAAGAWPLPPIEVAPGEESSSRREHPYADLLMEIAMYEKRHEDVLRWYRLCKDGGHMWPSVEDSVAEAVLSSYPDFSLGIWKSLAEREIDLVKPAAYLAAAGYLRKMRKVHQDTDRIAEWQAYMKDLRAVHKRKRRLIEVLDSLEATRIIDS